jgi:hypothetical protein
MDKDLQGSSAQTIRYLSFPQPILFAVSAQAHCASDPENTTWKKEAIFFFPSSEAIYLSRGGAIQVSGKGQVGAVVRPITMRGTGAIMQPVQASLPSNLVPIGVAFDHWLQGPR